MSSSSPTSDTDYYTVLGVERICSHDQINKAYRKLALQWHPDRNDAASKQHAESRFKLITEAYAVLSDPQKRQQYNREYNNPVAMAAAAKSNANTNTNDASHYPTGNQSKAQPESIHPSSILCLFSCFRI